MKEIVIIITALLLVQCEPLIPQQSAVSKQIIFDDRNYTDIVGFGKIFPVENSQVKELENPIVSLNNSRQLMLSFDLLTDQFENLSARIVHCNKDWNKSVLHDVEYLNQINNYRITEFEYSINTVQPYINYKFQIPKPSLSGNYILVVFRRAQPDNILLTRKFMIVDNKVSINPLVRVSTTIAKRNSNHQIEYSINYGNLLLNSPSQDISSILLQNHNWNTAIKDVPPTLIRINDGLLEYRHLDTTSNFLGWNEFRFADLRSLSVSGRNVGKITNTGSQIIAPLRLDGSRGALTYTQNFQDINGNFIIKSIDPGESFLNTDYANIQFNLKSDRIIGDVYVWGQFNNWQLNDLNRMRYNNDKNRYETVIPLKQGYYEYLYFVKSNDVPVTYFEGSHFQTDNQYEILVYYRKPGNINDELVGYKKFKSINP